MCLACQGALVSRAAGRDASRGGGADADDVPRLPRALEGAAPEGLQQRDARRGRAREGGELAPLPARVARGAHAPCVGCLTSNALAHLSPLFLSLILLSFPCCMRSIISIICYVVQNIGFSKV